LVFGLNKPNIKKMQEDLDVEGLIKALNYQESAQIRADAARALGVIGEQRASETPIQIKDEKQGVIKALTSFPVPILKDEKEDVLRAAIQAFLVIAVLVLLLRLIFRLWSLY
jgi:HEAT repeat protein